MTNTCPYILYLNKENCSVCIDKGRLIIKNPSSISVNESWLNKNRRYILQEIAILMNEHIFQYLSYSAGRFGEQKKYDGIALQFVDLLTGGSACRHYNACLTYARSTKAHKKGERFKNKKDFRVGCNHQVARDWLTWGLKPPSRWAALKDYLGNMKDLAFAGDYSSGETLSKESVQLIDVSNDDIQRLLDSKGIKNKHAFELDAPIFGNGAEQNSINTNPTTSQQACNNHTIAVQAPDSSRTSDVQGSDSGHTSVVQETDNSHTTTTHKDIDDSYSAKGLQGFLGAGEINYGLRDTAAKETRPNGVAVLRGTVVDNLDTPLGYEFYSDISLGLEASKDDRTLSLDEWLDGLNANLRVELPCGGPPWEEIGQPNNI
jgi:hypothetical protein